MPRNVKTQPLRSGTYWPSIQSWSDRSRRWSLHSPTRLTLSVSPHPLRSHQPGVIAIDALPGLAQMLNDSSHVSVRAQGVRAIGRVLSMSALAERSMPLASVVPAHRDGDAAVRAAVADALGRITSSATTDTIVQRTLETLARDSVATTRLRAVEALGALSAMARRAVLQTVLHDSSAASSSRRRLASRARHTRAGGDAGTTRKPSRRFVGPGPARRCSRAGLALDSHIPERNGGAARSTY